jgi:two-component system, response regulator
MENIQLVILLVEDNYDHAELVIRNLERHRIMTTITHVEDGARAIDYLYHKGTYTNPLQYPRPNLILLDLRLPKIDGLTVLQMIKDDEFLCTIPVVILTSSHAEADINSAYLRRANSYIVKPLDFPKFGQLMHDLGFYWLSWNVNP